jgi:leader peptidase (prepilin peptidase)/N-methyltransferase
VLLAAIGFLMGAFIGSFLNVVIHRMPRNESVVHPPSRCYSCGTGVRGYDNIPILSWLLLRGRCRFCQAPFSVRYCIGEALVGLMTAGVVYAVFVMPSYAPPVWLSELGVDPRYSRAAGAAAILIMVWWLWACSMIDYDHTIIPDELTKPWQLVAPALAVLTPINLMLWSPAPWFETHTGMSVLSDPWAGTSSVLWILLPCLAFLALSVPAARWVYGHFCPEEQRWSDEDHRGFAVGVWWFCAVTALQVIALVVLTMVAESAGPRGGVVASALVPYAQALMGSMAGWMSLYVVGLLGTMAFRRNAMGFGDVKFLAPIGAIIGPTGVLYTFFLASVVGAVVGIPVRLLGKGREIPFGPFLALGAVLAVVFGHQIHAFIFGGLAI